MDDKFIHTIIEDRRSSVLFSPREIDNKKLASLFEAARWAPSSYNEQPWRFMVVTKNDAENYAKVLGLLSEKNQEWAGNAYVLILTFAQSHFSRNGKENFYALHDLAQAVSYLTIQATYQGLNVHQMGGFSRANVNDHLHVPKEFVPVTAIAVGYPGELQDVSKELMLREMNSRKRNPLQEFVFGANWDNSFF